MTTLDLVRSALRDRSTVRDEDFASLYPPAIRAASPKFWTPVRVAVRAAELLAFGRHGGSVLDVGSGPGKLCIIGALTTSARFTGIERRGSLVSAAKEAASRLGVASSTSFVEGGLEGVDWPRYDAFYFYNPFMENVYSNDCQYDTSVELSTQRFVRDVTVARRGLKRTREGARVVTYHGFGDALPVEFRLEHSEPAGSGYLQVWVHATRNRDQKS